MKLAIMQPYFLPYIGYFQLIASVEKFIIYDNIKYTKKGWISRNRMLQNCEDKIFSLPLAKGSSSLDIIDRKLANEFNRQKLLNQFRENYTKAPYFKEVWPVIESLVLFQEDNLFRYIQNSILVVCDYLKINTEILIASCIDADHTLKGEDRVMSICRQKDATTYINPIGGIGLYSNKVFEQNGIKLEFLKSRHVEYDQGCTSMTPWLSILDVLMFNSLEAVQKMISSEYSIVSSLNEMQNPNEIYDTRST